MTEYVSNPFSVTTPDDCSCDRSDANKITILVFWYIALVGIIIAWINKKFEFIKNKLASGLLLWISVIINFSLGLTVYYDACKCSKSKYSKTHSSFYLAMSIILLILVILIETYGVAKTWAKASFEKYVTNKKSQLKENISNASSISQQEKNNLTALVNSIDTTNIPVD